MARVGACSEVTTWSNWTGSVPCWIGKVQLLGAVGASGVPGLTSTKKLPSRKMRGRIANVASLWIGRPLLLMLMVMSAAVHCWSLEASLVSTDPPVRHPGTAPTPVTWPTSTPAIRTGDPGTRPVALEKTAWIVYGVANGLANLVKPR